MPGPRPIISLLGHPPHCHPLSKIYKRQMWSDHSAFKDFRASHCPQYQAQTAQPETNDPRLCPLISTCSAQSSATSCPTFGILLHSLPTLCVLFLLIRRPVPQPLSSQTSIQASLKAQLTQVTSSGKLSWFPSRHALHLTPRHQPHLSVCLFTDCSSPSMLWKT